MWWILLIIVVLFFVHTTSAKPLERSNTKSYTVDFPNPEVASPKDVLEAIDNLAPFEVSQIERFLESQGLNYDDYKSAFRDKLMNRFNKAKYSYLLDSGEKFSNKTDKENVLHFDVAGCFVKGRKSHLLNNCSIGDEVTLVPEPKNKFDSNAIRIRCNGKLIGYIRADETDIVHDILENDYYAYLTFIDDFDGYMSAEIAIEY